MVYRFRSLWQRIAVTCERIMHIYTHEMSKIGSVLCPYIRHLWKVILVVYSAVLGHLWKVILEQYFSCFGAYSVFPRIPKNGVFSCFKYLTYNS